MRSQNAEVYYVISEFMNSGRRERESKSKVWLDPLTHVPVHKALVIVTKHIVSHLHRKGVVTKRKRISKNRTESKDDEKGNYNQNM